MRRVFVTGMSGTGKSSALAALAGRGFRTLDTDEPGWTEWSCDEDGYIWKADRVAELLSVRGAGPHFVSGAVSNQGRFYPYFDEVVLLSAPVGVLLERVQSRRTNDFGKSDAQRVRILQDLREFEPRMRRSCTVEIDATQPLHVVVERLARLALGADREAGPGRTTPD